MCGQPSRALKREFVLRFVVASLLLSPLAGVAQSTAPSTEDGLALLKSVAKRYADAKSYHIESVEDFTTDGELKRTWEKFVMTATVAPGGRYRYKGRSADGTAILVSDGKTRWDYHVDEKKYTEQPASVEPDRGNIQPVESSAWGAAPTLITGWAASLSAVTRLPDETVNVNGKEVTCYVFGYTDADVFHHETPGLEIKREGKIWIDSARRVIVKISRLSEFSGPAVTPQKTEQTITYPVVEFDVNESPSTFVFAPPAGVTRVAEFSVISEEDIASKFVGKPAPDLRLPGKDGKPILLSSMQGKPIFLEYWATWCAPCVEMLPKLKALYSETSSKGLVWITIDIEDDDSEAKTLLSTQQIPWANYHDSDGSLSRRYQQAGVPLGILIDANGSVVFYKMGYEIPELRAAIAKLGPEFTSTTELNSH